MALATLVKVSPMDTATGTRVDLYLSNVGDSLIGPKVNGLNGQVWVPAITSPPVLSIRTWNGDFTASVEPGEARLSFSLGPVKRRWASVDSYHWAGAPIEVYAEEPGTAWPWTARFVGAVRDYGGTKRKLNLSATVDERRFAKNILTATYAGTGGIEGSESLKGKVKPLVIGWATNVEPVLIDAVNNVYQFSGYGAIEGVTALYERGAPFPVSTGDYASYTALVAASIPNGGWATCLASGLIRLGAPQFGVITGDVKGHKVGAATPRLPGSVISALATIAGVAAGDINTTSLTAFDTGVPYPINLFIDSQAEFDSVAKEIALTCNWVAGISLRGKFFTAPVSLSPSAALTLNAQGGSKPQVLDVNEKSVSLPYWKTIMGAQRSWRVHSSDEIAFQEEGANAISGYLTKETTALPADSAGTVSDFSLASGTFKVFQGDVDKTSLSAFSLSTATGCTVSINATTGAYSVSAMSADSATATFQAVFNGVTITKVLSLTKARSGSNGSNGANASVLTLTSTAQTFTYDGTGTASPASQTITFTANLQNLSGTVAFSATGYNASGASIGAVTLSGTGNSRTMSNTQFGSAAYAVVTASLSGYSDTNTVVRLTAGANGTNGTNGTNGVSAISAYLTNESTGLFAYADGTVLSYSAATGSFKVFSGTTDVSASFTLSTNSNPQALTVSYVGQTYSITGGFDPSEDTATLTIRATGSGAYAGITLDKVFTLTKVKGGYEIVGALPSTNLFEGRMVYLTTDDKLYRYTGSAWISSVAATDISGTLSDAQLAAISASKVTGQLTDSQLSAISAAKVTGTLSDSQLAAISAAKVTGTLSDSQLAAISAAKVIGGSGGGNLLSNTNFKNVTGTLNSDGSLPVNWGIYNNGSISVTTRVVSGGLFGTNYVRITANASTASTLGIYTQAGSGVWTPGLTYMISFWARAGSAGAVGQTMQALYSNMGFTSATEVANPTLVQTTWQRYIWRVQPASNAATPVGELFLSITQGSFPSGGVIEICGGQVEQGEMVSSYAPRPDEILPSTITATEIADNSITTAKVVAGSITTAKIAAGAVTANEIAANTITSSQIAADTITAANIAASAITASELAAGAVTAGKIAAGSIVAGDIAAGTITGDRIAASTITGSQIAADTITAANIAASAITASELAAGAVTAGKIAAGSIVAGDIAAGTITGDRIAANAITATQIAADAVTTNKIAAGAITAAKMNVTDLSSITANIGTLTAGTIRNIADTFQVDATNGRTIVQNGGYMKVTGAPFGSSNQFIEWYGPYFASLSSCTEANAVYYLKTNGSAYFGGSLSAGILKNAAQTSATDATASVTVGPFGTNGNPIQVVTSYNLSSQLTNTYPATTTGVSQWNSAVSTWGGTSTNGVASGSKSVSCNVVVRVDRLVNGVTTTGWATLTITSSTETISGMRPEPADSTEGWLTFARVVTGSITSTDSAGGTQNRTFTATITTRTSAITGAITSQRVGIVATE